LGESACDSLKDPYIKARCFHSAGKYDDALFAMHKAVKADSGGFMKSYFYLQLLLACEDKTGLKKFLPVFHKRYLDSGEVAIECARGYAHIRKWKKAIGVLEHAYERKMKFDYLSEMMGIYIEFKKYSRAASIVEKILRIDSTYAEAHRTLGIIALNKGIVQKVRERKKKGEDIREALGHFQKAAYFDSTNYRYFIDIAAMYDTLDIWDSTCLAYMKAVELNDRDFGLLFRFGKKLFDHKQYDDALMVLEKAFLVDSMELDLLMEIEKVHKRRGTFDTYYLTGQERLANALPDTLSIRYNLAIEYTNREMWDKAVHAYKIILEKDPEYEAVHRGIAAIYLMQENCEAAIPHLVKQAKLFSGDYKDSYNLAQCYLMRGDTAGAIRTYDKALEKNPNHAPTAYFLGTHYYNAKDYAKCIRALRDNPEYQDTAGV
jgi:tetratricopeptide (TPR) repeat protein